MNGEPGSEHILNIFLSHDIVNCIRIFYWMDPSDLSYVCPIPTDAGRFAQTGVLFELQDLKKVSEQTSDAIKYICNQDYGLTTRTTTMMMIVLSSCFWLLIAVLFIIIILIIIVRTKQENSGTTTTDIRWYYLLFCSVALIACRLSMRYSTLLLFPDTTQQQNNERNFRCSRTWCVILILHLLSLPSLSPSLPRSRDRLDLRRFCFRFVIVVEIPWSRIILHFQRAHVVVVRRPLSWCC